MKILITGGAGFIGSHLVRYHLNKGDHVWCVDNISSGKRENLEKEISSPNFHFDVQDVCTWNRLQEAVEWSDRIYNMAAVVGMRLVISNPVNTLKVNIQSCEKILDAMCKTKKDIQLLIASSSSVYGHNALTSYREDAELTVMSGECFQQSYSLSKLMNEEMGLAYAHQKKINCTIARLFNIVGPHQTGRYGMVIPNFIEQALKGMPLTVFGDGKQTRSFCNVKDAVEAMDLLLSNPNSKNEIVNVGSDREISIYELALLVREKTHSQSEIRFIPYEEAFGIEFQDILRRQPCLDKLKRLTGFRFKYSLEQTIDQIIETFKSKVSSTT